MLIAKRGEVVTCERGHRVCVVVSDISSDQTVSVDQFENWSTDAPKTSEPILPCPICGADYIRSMGLFGHQLHIGDAWHPPAVRWMLPPAVSRKWWQFWKRAA